MFNLLKEVPNLELCYKLKQLGYPQEKEGIYWVEAGTWGDPKTWKLGFKNFFKHAGLLEKECIQVTKGCGCCADFETVEGEIIKAPTCHELSNWIPHKIETKVGECYLHISKSYDVWWCGYESLKYETYLHLEKDNTLANTLAKILIWLVEEGYVKFKKKEK